MAAAPRRRTAAHRRAARGRSPQRPDPGSAHPNPLHHRLRPRHHLERAHHRRHPRTWSTASELASTGFLGANGLKIHNGALWATNLDRGTLLRIPILRNGSAGTVQTRATGMAGIDDFAFTGQGDQILATLNGPSEVALIQPDGTHSTVLTAADGLQNPTSLALRGDTAYVLSAAYITAKDPNLLLAHLNE